MRTVILILIIWLCSHSLLAIEPEVVLRLSWGDGQAQAGLYEAPEARYGPQSFTVRDGKIFLLDNYNGYLKLFDQGYLQSEYAVDRECSDFALLADQSFYLLCGNQVLEWQSGQTETVYKPQAREVIQGLNVFQSGGLNVTFAGGNSRLLPMQANSVLRKGKALSSAVSVECIRRSGRRAELRWHRRDSADSTLTIDFDSDDLASIRLIGVDNEDRLFVNVERFVSQAPLEIRREVHVYSASGRALAVLHVPVDNYAEAFRDMYVSEDGVLYHMLRLNGTLEIIRWEIPFGPKGQEPYFIEYPEELRQTIPPYQGHLLYPADGPADTGLYKTAQVTQVDPEEALTIGDSYVQLGWQCSSDNITNGLITDSYGHQVLTPSWVTVGDHEKVPYKWGGFETVNQFVNGLGQDKYAGDRYTSKSSGTPSAIGVDCSGFVSRCWKLSAHYSTRMMDDYITLPYESWEQTRPGDAAHKAGHVRLIVQHNPDGSILMVEAAGYNWRVSYKNYYYSALGGYTPRYYREMSGTPGNIPQPRWQSICMDKQLAGMHWQTGSRESIAGFNLYTSTDGTDWTLASNLPADSSKWNQPVNAGETRYYRLRSLAASDQVSESLPSDGYGFSYRSGTPKVLIVDGFDRTASNSGSWSHSYHDFAVSLGEALRACNISFETASNEELLNGGIEPEAYPALFWILGDESTVNETFNSEEQEMLKNYLRQGGSLFVSGSEVGWDLDNKGSSGDREFYNQFLKADYAADDASDYTVSGAANSPFAGLNLSYDDGNHGIYEEDYPDVISAASGGKVALNYSTGKAAAVYFEGLFDQGTHSGKIFYMAFPLETVYNTSQRDQLIARVVDFFNLQTTAISVSDSPDPETFELQGNFPNPFNGQTQIRFVLPGSGLVDLQVYDALGRRQLQKQSSFDGPGTYFMNLDANQWASGLYFYRLQFKHGGLYNQKSGRMLLVK